jgi:hypothetical protein
LIFRIVAVGAVALLLAATVVRTALVEQYAAIDPRRAAAIWPTHPDVELALGLMEIGSATHSGQPVSEETIERLMDAARKAPLESEPFLVRGVQAQLSGNFRVAGEAFRAAKLRDGRNSAARYFLAEHYLKQGDAARGLSELAFLARLVPNGAVGLGPYIAAYARDPKNAPQLRALFRSDPNLADSTLATLARDPANAGLVQSLADVAKAPVTSPWVAQMVASLIAAKDYARARQVWARNAHVESAANATIFDPDFNNRVAPPPFAWSLTSSSVGLAERGPGGGLRVIYYGQEDGVLASQLLLLKPGRYRLAMRAGGDPSRARSLVWTLTCAGSATPFARFPLDPGEANRGWTFDVPAGCPAQTIALSGVSSDMPQEADVTISGLRLEPNHG